MKSPRKQSGWHGPESGSERRTLFLREAKCTKGTALRGGLGGVAVLVRLVPASPEFRLQPTRSKEATTSESRTAEAR